MSGLPYCNITVNIRFHKVTEINPAANLRKAPGVFVKKALGSSNTKQQTALTTTIPMDEHTMTGTSKPKIVNAIDSLAFNPVAPQANSTIIMKKRQSLGIAIITSTLNLFMLFVARDIIKK
ncbi:TPA: hypothetical protein ME573_002952 [Klebsiella pneumoniae]|nr:hypothetical protein [Klebsiella pneumoniae]HBV5279175.1 hypothetical protein [Klebsiella pneumoniae]HBV5825053.1 hypothetical protein [Klebsiella pneumoniae]HBW4528037.1 hypothetical protein [Klebsiella pneumoniae]HBW4550958.1 hypothetical protein [Klebsiella pneumoniae]